MICPACESSDHEHSELCEKDYKCECACHHRFAKIYWDEVLDIGDQSFEEVLRLLSKDKF